MSARLFLFLFLSIFLVRASGQTSTLTVNGSTGLIAAPISATTFKTVNNIQPLNSTLTALAGNTTTTLNLNNVTLQVAGLSGSGAGLSSLNAANISSGTLASARGGAGTISGLLKANGSGAVSAATAGTDYLSPAAIGTTIQAYSANLAALSAGSITITKPTGSTPNALRIAAGGGEDAGVLDLQNTGATGNDFAAVNFLNTAGAYRFSVGYGNTSFAAFASAAYLEANNLVGASQVPPNIHIVQTGTTAASAYDQNVRMQFVGNGYIKLFGRTPATVFGPTAIQVAPSGRVRIGPEGATDPAPNLDSTIYGFAQFLQPSGSTTAVSFTQDGVATGYLGFAASSSTLILGNDGGAISFRSNPGGALTSGTERASLNLTTGLFTAGGFKVTPQATAPSSPAEGQIYADSSDHHLYFYNGTTWKQLDN